MSESAFERIKNQGTYGKGSNFLFISVSSLFCVRYKLEMDGMCFSKRDKLKFVGTDNIVK